MLLLAALLAAFDAGAATFTVNSTADQADAVPGNGFCSVMTGICSLRAAIQEANALAGPDVIQLPAGNFAFSIAGAGEDFAATGDLDIRGDLVIEGASAATTVIDANSVDRAFDVPPAPSAALSVTIRNVTIREGATSGAAGAGIRHDDDGTLAVEDAILEQNQVSGTSSDATGGAISSEGNGTLEVRRSLLAHNGADRGGAIFYNGTFAIWDSTFDTNTGRTGAAIQAYGNGTVERCTLVENVATNGSTVNVSVGSLVLQNSTLSGNDSSLATIVASGSSLALESVTASGNAAPMGIWVVTGVSLVNSVLIGTSGGPECSITGGSVTSLGHNLDDDDTCGAAPGDIPAQNPLLAPLASNGGPTETHLPAAGSPLANAGLDSACLLEDQRGFLRNLGPGNACDVGAVEFSVPEAGAGLAGVTALAALGALRRRAASRRPQRERELR